jgi:hypothetical protein
MTRPHTDFIGATDASQDFGIGACVAEMSPERLSSVGKLCSQQGQYVTLRGPSQEPRVRSVGTPHPVGLEAADFHTVLCVRCNNSEEHINLREARALLMYLKWVLRSGARHGRRIVVLVDSLVVVGAVCKGRSGSYGLNRILRQIFMLCFAGGLTLQVVYVPSEHNPADYPSRGRRLPRDGRSPPRIQKVSRFERYMRDRACAVRRLIECGALSPCSSTNSDSFCWE